MSVKERVQVLLVDDNAANLLALENVLRSPEIAVTKAKSGNEALAALLEGEFACVLMDVQMPGMDGFELASIIRNDERTKDMPIIFASGSQRTESDVFKGYENGAIDYLLKPLDASIVRSKIRVFAELYRRRLESKRNEEKLAAYAEELKRSNAELDQFASIAAHDLQAPLRAIDNGAGILAEDFQGKLGGDADKWLGRIRSNAERMRVLINDLLSFAKVGRRQPSIDLDLSRLVGEVLRDLATAIEESGAKISYENLPQIVASPLELRQLLQNLLSNAIKYRKKETPPEIQFSVKQQEEMWLFQIRDNGMGIDPSHREKVFEIFSRLHSAADIPGTGIGLAICKKIVEHHGGKIWFESQVGEGCTFSFTLPREEVQLSL